jgi:hypothetical protein
MIEFPKEESREEIRKEILAHRSTMFLNEWKLQQYFCWNPSALSLGCSVPIPSSNCLQNDQLQPFRY